MNRGVHELSPEEFEETANATGALILDTRKPAVFVKGFIPNSINIGLDGNFAPWVGALITDIKQKILLITDKGREEEAVTRLARVGYDNTIGFLKDGFESWSKSGKEVDSINSISAEEFAQRYKQSELRVIDVRKISEYDAEHVKDAENIPLDYINDNMTQFNDDSTMYLHCAGGYRSVIAASILKARGFENIVDIAGGFKAISDTNIPKTDFVCPTGK